MDFLLAHEWDPEHDEADARRTSESGGVFLWSNQRGQVWWHRLSEGPFRRDERHLCQQPYPHQRPRTCTDHHGSQPRGRERDRARFRQMPLKRTARIPIYPSGTYSVARYRQEATRNVEHHGDFWSRLRFVLPGHEKAAREDSASVSLGGEPPRGISLSRTTSIWKQGGPHCRSALMFFVLCATSSVPSLGNNSRWRHSVIGRIRALASHP